MKWLATILLGCLLAVLLGCSVARYQGRVDVIEGPRYYPLYYPRVYPRYYPQPYPRYIPRHRGARLYATDGVIIEVAGPTPYEREWIRSLAGGLNFTGQPMVSWWRIVILNRADWDDAMLRYKLGGLTGSAFTVLGQNATFVREDYMEFASASQLQFTLAHEAGHLICNCTSEDKANQIARQLVK